MEKFNCDRCTGVCCLIPPQISIEEVEKARRLGAEVIGVMLPVGTVALYLVQNYHHTCPFLEDTKCGIYEDRFKSCKGFECRAKDTTLQVMGNIGYSNRMNKMTTGKTAFILTYTTVEIEALNIPIVDRETARNYISGHSAEKLTQMIKDCDYEYSET